MQQRRGFFPDNGGGARPCEFDDLSRRRGGVLRGHCACLRGGQPWRPSPLVLAGRGAQPRPSLRVCGQGPGVRSQGSKRKPDGKYDGKCAPRTRRRQCGERAGPFVGGAVGVDARAGEPRKAVGATSSTGVGAHRPLPPPWVAAEVPAPPAPPHGVGRTRSGQSSRSSHDYVSGGQEQHSQWR